MFNLDKHDAEFSHLNLRKENHGDEKVAAADLRFSLQASALLLDTIDPKLRKAFFAKPGKGEQQALPIDGNSLLEHIDPVFFADAKVKKIAFTPIEGGSIDVTLTISVLLDDEDDAPVLAAWRRGSVALSLTPPAKAAEKADGDTLDAQDEADAKAEAARLIEAGKQAA